MNEETPAPARRVAVLTHRRIEDTREALRMLLELAPAAGATLRFDAEETRKHGLSAAPGVEVDASIGVGPGIGAGMSIGAATGIGGGTSIGAATGVGAGVLASANVDMRAGAGAKIGAGAQDDDLCLVLGGDGTILYALRLYAGARVPVFAINFGEIGFLATVEPEDAREGLTRALSGRFELLRLPGIVVEIPGGGAATAINDIAVHRRVGERVAELAYAVDGEEVGSVRCDGLVLATPAGSTGYNLANGGPVMAWGVEGVAVSFIAPHSITARSLVVAPGDPITVHNRSREPLDVSVDGRPVGELAPDACLRARFADDVGTIAQLPDSSFYRRLREKFGRLAR